MSDVELLHFSEENLHTGEGARVLHQCGVPATYKIHTHDFYELFLVSHGGAIHAVNGRSQLLSEGSFVLMRPRDVHRYDFFNNADFELLDIGIPRAVFERLCDYLQLDRAIFDFPDHATQVRDLLPDEALQTSEVTLEAPVGGRHPLVNVELRLVAIQNARTKPAAVLPYFPASKTSSGE